MNYYYPSVKSFDCDHFLLNPSCYLIYALHKAKQFRKEDFKYFDLMVAYLHSTTCNINISKKKDKINPEQLQLFSTPEKLERESLVLIKECLDINYKKLGWIINLIPTLGLNEAKTPLKNYQYKILLGTEKKSKIAFFGVDIKEGFIYYQLAIYKAGFEWTTLKTIDNKIIGTVFLPFDVPQYGYEEKHHYPFIPL